jgi:NAD(P)-dependent dehydrogenase (short-subunit alcohol dehydrogenase family)
MRLDGRTALITGAGGPMGEAVATRFAEEGAGLVLTDISGGRLAAACERIRASLRPGADLVFQRADVRLRGECEALVQASRGRFARIDALINVVGGIRGASLGQSVLELPESRWDDTMTLNLKGALHLTQLVAPQMLENRYGRIVNFSSINMAGEAGAADYGAAKAAVASFTRTLALELAPHVNVNCIAPGLIRTSVMQRQSAEDAERYVQRTALKRIGEPREIANACLFLASEEASYVTGEMLAVAGGIWPAL